MPVRASTFLLFSQGPDFGGAAKASKLCHLANLAVWAGGHGEVDTRRPLGTAGYLTVQAVVAYPGVRVGLVALMDLGHLVRRIWPLSCF